MLVGQALAALVGLVTSMVALESHGFANLSAMIHAGIIIGANLVCMVPSAAVFASLDR